MGRIPHSKTRDNGAQFNTMKDQYFKAVKVRLYPNSDQLILLEKSVGCVRFMFNKALAARSRFHSTTGESLTAYDMINNLSSLKKKYPWLLEVDSQSLQQAVLDVNTAYTRFFKGTSKFPRYKKKNVSRQSFRLTTSSVIRVDGNFLKLGKLGVFLFRGNCHLLQDKKLRSITVSKDAGKWYASCLTEFTPESHIHQFQSAIGIDLGVAIPLALAGENGELKSMGKKFSKDLSKKECRRKHYQRKFARTVKGSKNRMKVCKKVSVAYQRERQFRKDFVEQTSHTLTFNFETLVFENLNVSGMTRQVKKNEDGTPRVNVSAKAGLNRSMLRIGLGMLVTRCQQKARERGGSIVLVDPRYTSQTCSDCGSVDKLSRESQARFRCVHCGFKLNADHNAARNILAKGLSLA